MANQKAITKFVENIEGAYVSVLEKTIRVQLEETISPIGNEINEYIKEKLAFIRKNGGLLFIPEYFQRSQRISSNQYNNIMSNIKIDLEAVITQMNEVVNLANMADNVNQIDFIDNIAFANDNKAKIRNLKTLFDSNKEFNGYQSNSFVSDDNTYEDTQFSTKFSNGMHKLQSFISDPVTDEENDASVDSSILNDSIFVKRNSGDIFSERVLDGRFISAFSILPAKFQGNINGELITYPGIVVAYRIELSDIRQMNSLSFSYFSNSDIDVLKILHTDTIIQNLSSQQWQEITDYTTDSENFGSIEYNFDTINAREIVVIIGQKFVSSEDVSVTDDEMNKFMEEYNIENTLENENGKLKMLDEITDASYLNVIKRDKVVYRTPYAFKQLDSKLGRQFDEFIKKIYGTVNRLNDFGGFIYYLNMFNLRIYKNQYKQFSVYESDTIRQEGSLINARITKTEKIPEGTWINHYILYGNHKVRVIEKNDNIKDIITVDEIGKTIFPTDFLIDANKLGSIIVLKNNISITNFNLDFINNDIGKGIILDTAPKFNDVIVIDYDLPKYDEFGIPYKPWNINILKTGGRPNIIDDSLINITNTNRALLTTDSNECVYPISTRFKYDSTAGNRTYYIHKEDVLDIQLADFNALQQDAIADPDQNFKLYDMIAGITPSGTFYKIPESIVTSGQVTKYVEAPRKDIYYGIINEQVTDEIQPLIIGNNQKYITDFDYIPGTIKAKIQTEDELRNVSIDEYISTSPITNYAKNEFYINTSKLNVQDEIQVSYVPMDIEGNTKAISNILDFNDFERHFQTIGATIQINRFPYVDYAIIAQSIGSNPIWVANDNKYALRDNVSIIYTPMEIRIDGGEPARNITDFIDGTTPDLSLDEYKFDEAKRNYVYYIDGNKLLFNIDITGNIEIRYYTLNDRIKLRSEFYRYNLKRYDITPELYDILVLTNTI